MAVPLDPENDGTKHMLTVNKFMVAKTGSDQPIGSIRPGTVETRIRNIYKSGEKPGKPLKTGGLTVETKKKQIYWPSDSRKKKELPVKQVRYI
ncbi:uncharacterized protein G2W53_007302 [Senna tora]|uniref:Uncharacterized protein n=1 Tax=Senna tora TaxID=362788 RepID=A0A834X6I7_9FABA|nr:uncharacterized protein G2W53_007302 [Senna tora]